MKEKKTSGMQKASAKTFCKILVGMTFNTSGSTSRDFRRFFQARKPIGSF